MLESLGHLLTDAGPAAYALAPAFMVVVAILPLPAEVPAMVIGMVFGPAVGAGVTWASALLGAAASFEIARRWGRPLAERVVPAATLGTVDRAAAAAGWGGLLAARLIPTIAFTALNWGLGLCEVPRRRFYGTTALGILPGAVAFTWMGSGLGALYREHPLAGTLAIAAVLVAATTAALRFRRTKRTSDGTHNADPENLTA